MRVFKIGPSTYTVHVDMRRQPLHASSDDTLPIGAIRRLFTDSKVNGQTVTAIQKIQTEFPGHPLEVIEEYKETGGTVAPPTAEQAASLDKITGSLKTPPTEEQKKEANDGLELRKLAMNISKNPPLVIEAYEQSLPQPEGEPDQGVPVKSRNKDRDFILQKLTQAKFNMMEAKNAKDKNILYGRLEGMKEVAIALGILTVEEIKGFLNE